MPVDAANLYGLIMDRARRPARVQQLALGLAWSLARVQAEDAEQAGVGLCFSPTEAPRNLPWSGSLAGRSADELIPWLCSWNSSEAVVGATVVNALINHTSPLPAQAQTLAFDPAPHLSVFDYFKPQLKQAKVAVIGRYPGLERFREDFDFTCIERRPGPGDLPDAAANWILPQADWVFITASSIANKTLPHLLSLCPQAQVVLMGPSLPWLPEWADFGVNYLAGVVVNDPDLLLKVLLEGGGTNIFVESVSYRLLPL
ncbi:MAG: DUF364 domain-containing protein [Pseudomonadota bacterium]|nr:DUF364 domain-containing protein [Pseudomonadota bacterium]